MTMPRKPAHGCPLKLKIHLCRSAAAEWQTIIDGNDGLNNGGRFGHSYNVTENRG